MNWLKQTISTPAYIKDLPYGNHFTYMISFSPLSTLNEEGGWLSLF